MLWFAILWSWIFTMNELSISSPIHCRMTTQWCWVFVSGSHYTSVLVYLQCASHVSGSVRAESVAASRVEQTLSEVASSAGSILHSRPGCQETWLLQAQIWLHLGKLTSIHVYLHHIATTRKRIAILKYKILVISHYSTLDIAAYCTWSVIL